MKIYSLNNIPIEQYAEVGGKAKGLNQISRAGYKIPTGFVIVDVDINDSNNIKQIKEYYNQSKFKAVAIRSSATAEDGIDFSAAGQYSTFLNVEGDEDLIDAIKKCLNSLKNETANSYSNFFGQIEKQKMSVIVQEMVEAAKAGVCFTLNPISSDNTMLIEAIEGLGEDLVAGNKSAYQYKIPNNEFILNDEYKREENILSPAELEKLYSDAQKLKEAFRLELDLEWAINSKNEIFWLQSRPITTEDTTIHELDCTVDLDNNVVTTCNIGEMLPNAVTPLSLSTSVSAIDNGLREMLVIAGAFKKLDDVPHGSCALSIGNHLFLNLTIIKKIGATVLGASDTSIDLSICGKVIKDVPPLQYKKSFILKRLYNCFKYFKYLLSRNKARAKLSDLNKSFSIKICDDIKEQYDDINKKMWALDKAFAYHYVTSAHSGAMSGALFVILSKDMNEDQAKGVIAGLLEDIDDIESVDILRSLRLLAKEIINENPDVINYDSSQLTEYCKHLKEEKTIQAYENFMNKHGHRAIREAELRSKSWKDDEEAFINFLRTVISTGANEVIKEQTTWDKNLEELLNNYRGSTKKALKYLTKQARDGVKNREASKSMSIRITDQFKIGYNNLSKLLVNEKVLPDNDLIYFFTHQELGQLINEKKICLIKKALSRRRLLSEQQLLKFNEISIGRPMPIVLDIQNQDDSAILSGTPISRGVVTGIARVVKSLEDAKKLVKGEIMVSSFTDIGWSPFYCLISGLVTEVGSVLSHGAVVAREYSLPLVSNIHYATEIIKTGDLITVDGKTGTVTIVEQS